MFEINAEEDVFELSDALSSLSELENNTSESILRERTSERIQIQTRVTVRPGNGSERQSYSIQALTGDVSNGGTLMLTGRPVMPGDIYWLEFSDEHLAIGSLLARCMRCRMVREDTYELGFRFFQDIDLAESII